MFSLCSRVFLQLDIQIGDKRQPPFLHPRSAQSQNSHLRHLVEMIHQRQAKPCDGSEGIVRMKFTDLTVGDVIPASIVRGITSDQPTMRGGVPACVWHGLTVAPGREVEMIRRFDREGVFAFCPMETRTRFVRGRKIERRHPLVTQIIYARFRKQPQWDVMKDRRMITGVFCRGTTPIVFPKDIIRAIQGLPTSAERLQAAKDELRRVHVGEVVNLLDGPLAGLAVDVTKVSGRKVWWQSILANGFPVRGECDLDEVEKQKVA